MAIQFTSDLPNDKVLNAYNNNVVSFKSNSGTNAIYSTISISGGASITITPNSGGLFSYNFKGLFKNIINRNHFRDDIYTNLSGSGGDYVKKDNHVYRDITVSYSIMLEDGNTETTSKSYRVLRSVVQLEDYRKGLTNIDNTSIALLLPFVENSSKTYRATMFDGYPFDVAIYSNAFREIVLNNKTTGHQYTASLSRGVNRFFFSDGQTNITLENDLPIALGINEIEISVNGVVGNNDKLTLFLNKKEGCSGHLLKWFTDQGGWCYFLFNESIQDRRVKEIGDFPSSLKNIENTTDPFTSLGYDKSENIDLFGDQLDIYEKRLVNSMFGSPKVYLHLNQPFQEEGAKDFLPVKLDTNSVPLQRRVMNLYSFNFSIERPLLKTMTL